MLVFLVFFSLALCSRQPSFADEILVERDRLLSLALNNFNVPSSPPFEFNSELRELSKMVNSTEFIGLKSSVPTGRSSWAWELLGKVQRARIGSANASRNSFMKIMCDLSQKISFQRIMRRDELRWALLFSVICASYKSEMRRKLDLIIDNVPDWKKCLVPDYNAIKTFLIISVKQSIWGNRMAMFDLYFQKASAVWSQLYMQYFANPDSVSADACVIKILLLEHPSIASPVDAIERKVQALKEMPSTIMELNVESRSLINSYLHLLIWALYEIATNSEDRYSLNRLDVDVILMFS